MLIAASIAAGLAEAAILALVVQLALALSEGDSNVGARLGPLFDLHASVTTLLLVAMGLSAGRILLNVAVAYLPSRTASDVQTRLRRETFELFVRASWAVQAKEREGHLQELLSPQINRSTHVVLSLATAINAGFNFLALLASAFLLNFQAALLIVIAAGGLFFALRPLARTSQNAAHRLAQSSLDFVAGVSESVRMSEEVKVFGVGEAQQFHVSGLIERVARPFFRTQFTTRVVPLLYQGVTTLLIVCGLGVLYLLKPSNLATLSAVVLILIRALTYSQTLQSTYQAARESVPFIDLVQQARALYRESIPRTGAEPLPAIKTVSFERVTFGYSPDRDVLRDVSFSFEAGEAIGLVGPSGSGKSTLVQVMLRLHEASSGRYLINGRSAFDYRDADWYRQVAYVPQEPRVITGTVAENIRFLRPSITDADVVRAAALANLHADIETWSAGYDTLLGQRSNAISGGQRQRLALARALAGRPSLLVLDEPTSALDLRSEALVHKSLATLRGEMTLIVISHRLSILSACGRILVLVDGRLEAFDTAERLERTNGFFRDAVKMTADASGLFTSSED